MIPSVIGVSGTIGNGNWCVLPDFLTPAVSSVISSVTGGVQNGLYYTQMYDLATYQILTGSGVSGGTATFQELYADGVTWVNLASPAPITLAATTAYNGVLNGPFLALRIVIASISGGTISQMMLKGSCRTL